MVKQNIGKIANLIGLTSEGIRYYERRGVIKTRDDNQRPRMYDTWDLYFFMRIKAYQNFGFSLDEIEAVMNDHSHMQLESQFISKESALRDEIKFKTRVLEHMEYTRHWFDTVHQNFNKIIEVTSEGFYRLPLQNAYVLDSSPEQLEYAKSMFSLSPFVFATSKFAREDVNDRTSTFTFGLGILERYADMIPTALPLEYIPQQRCISYIFESSNEVVLTPQKFRQALDYIYENGFTICGDVTTRVLGYHRVGDIKRNFHQAFIPICEKKDN